MDPEKGLKEDLKAYKKLDKINDSQEFNDYFQYQITQVVQKMVSCFTEPGDKSKAPKNWDEFCRVRGEILAALVPIQQIRGAKFVTKQLQEQLDQMYNNKLD